MSGERKGDNSNRFIRRSSVVGSTPIDYVIRHERKSIKNDPLGSGAWGSAVAGACDGVKVAERRGADQEQTSSGPVPR